MNRYLQVYFTEVAVTIPSKWNLVLGVVLNFSLCWSRNESHVYGPEFSGPKPYLAAFQASNYVIISMLEFKIFKTLKSIWMSLHIGTFSTVLDWVIWALTNALIVFISRSIPSTPQTLTEPTLDTETLILPTLQHLH